MKVYQNILLLFSCQFIHTLALECEVIRDIMKQIDAGSGSVVLVNDQNEVFVLKDNVFTKINTPLKHFSVGPAGQFGVDAANKIFKLQGGGFVQFPGIIKQVDAGVDQVIAGVNVNNCKFCSNMDANNNWPSSTNHWIQMNGQQTYYSSGPCSCWGVNSNNQINVKKATKVMSKC